MNRQKENVVIISGAIAAALIIGAFLVLGSQNAKPFLWDVNFSEADAQKAYEYAPSPASTLVQFSEGVNTWYVNEDLRFSFRLPDGFSAPDGRIAGTDTRVVQVSNKKGDELHIVVKKIIAGTEHALTEEIIRTQSADENISGVRSESLPDGTAGFVFHTDSSEWDGVGLAFWFIKDGFLYTLTTFEKDAELLEAVIKTWRFGGAVPPSR